MTAKTAAAKLAAAADAQTDEQQLADDAREARPEFFGPAALTEPQTDEQIVDAALGVEPTADDQLAADAANDGAPVRATRARKSAAKSADAEPIKVSIHIGQDSNFKVHRVGCRDIKRELTEHHLEPAHVAEYATVEQIVRGEWADQIGDNWDYAQGDPSLEYLAEHGFVDSIDVLPCIARKLVALPPYGDAAAKPTARRSRTPRPTAEPKHRAALGALDSIPGYVVVKSTVGFDQLKRSDLGGDSLPNAIVDETDPAAPAANRAEWLTRCNYHGKTTVAANRKAGRGLGATGARAAWCSGCKRDAAKLAAAADTRDAAADATAEHDAAAKSE
jgi:hypothetical protein